MRKKSITKQKKKQEIRVKSKSRKKCISRSKKSTRKSYKKNHKRVKKQIGGNPIEVMEPLKHLESFSYGEIIDDIIQIIWKYKGDQRRRSIAYILQDFDPDTIYKVLSGFGTETKANPLIEAILQEDHILVETFLEYAISPNFTDSVGFTPLYYATILNNEKIFLLLINFGAQLNDSNILKTIISQKMDGLFSIYLNNALVQDIVVKQPRKMSRNFAKLYRNYKNKYNTRLLMKMCEANDHLVKLQDVEKMMSRIGIKIREKYSSKSELCLLLGRYIMLKKVHDQDKFKA